MIECAPVIDAAALGRLQHAPGLDAMTRGIEKESLRVARNGYLSQRAHPVALGSTLTHPQITTDFSESQLELITGVHASPEACLDELCDVHRFVYQNLGGELLWPASMPCMLSHDFEIPLGRYGSSNVGMSKTVYRRGLGNRYGRLMQTISGVHYNFSLPEKLLASLGHITQQQRTDAYFGLIRNFRRFSWLLLYLFGASPAICKSFAAGGAHRLESYDNGSLYLPHGTALRMGRLGYQSDAQQALHVSYNSLEEYAASMRLALTQVHPPYEEVGLKVDGEYQQLNTTLIQIENEFYGSIRPKRPTRSGERPLTALTERGVEYVEVRCLDLNPFLPLGIDSVEIRFLDSFLLYCLLADSPPDSPEESAEQQRNQTKVVEQGRKTGLALEQNGTAVALSDWAASLIAECNKVATALDQAAKSSLYQDSVEVQRRKVQDANLTPSARILEHMRDQEIPFFRFAMNQALAHKGFFEERPLTEAQDQAFAASAAQSLVEQKAIEAADSISFDEYLKNYLELP